MASQYALQLLIFESIEEIIARIILTFYFPTRISDKKSSDVLLYGKKVKTCYAELVENNQYQQSWVDESNA